MCQIRGYPNVEIAVEKGSRLDICLRDIADIKTYFGLAGSNAQNQALTSALDSRRLGQYVHFVLIVVGLYDEARFFVGFVSTGVLYLIHESDSKDSGSWGYILLFYSNEYTSF